MNLRLVFVIVLLAPFHPFCAAQDHDEADLRRVADAVLRQTTRRLIDRSTGQTFEDSTALDPKPEISIESKFNAWFYQTWLLTDGMRRTADALHEPKYRDYGGLRPMQYHPDAGWLKKNGYSETLAKCVHIPRADDFLSPYENHRMPWVALHELAHAYHDQVLGFDHARIEAVWKKFCDSGKYKTVLTSPGHLREHYGLTNAKEFFAEMTESYFGSNDFYPFVTGELKQAEPETFTLMSEIWGPLPRPHSKP